MATTIDTAAPTADAPVTIRPEHIGKLDRYARLSLLRKYFESKQYDGRPDFFTGQRAPHDKPVPLRERKPCVIYPLPKAAVGQVAKFTFGDSRFPTVNIESQGEEDDTVLSLKLSEEEAEALENYAAALVDTGELKSVMRRIMRPGLAVGTNVAILTLVRGVFTVKCARAEDCWPTFKDNDPDGEVVKLTWCYQYWRTILGPSGVPERKRHWYRQDVDAEAYSIFPAIPVESGKDPQWGEPQKVQHEFGFCPVAWIRNIPEDSDSGDIDGTSLYEGLLPDFDALNFTLSQRHRGVHNFGTPQPYETGVEEGDGPGATGRRALPGYGSGGGAGAPIPFTHGADGRPASSTAPPHGYVASPGGGDDGARKGGPDQVWSYEGKDVEVGIIETTGKAFEVATLHVNDIRSRILEAMSVVLVSVADVVARTSQREMSAKFLELAYEPLLALVDEMRVLWWTHGLKAILSMMMRATAAIGGKRLLIPGSDKAAAILSRFFVETDQGKLWLPPKMTPTWGNYFSAGAEEIQNAITAAQAAKDASLVPKDDAIKFVLPYFGREDTHDAIVEIEEQAEEMRQKAQEDAQAELATLHAMAASKKPTKVDEAKAAAPEEPEPKE